MTFLKERRLALRLPSFPKGFYGLHRFEGLKGLYF
jgi:hypothetical protein